MIALCHMLLAICTTAFAAKAVERFETPHWISLLPAELDKQIGQLQTSSTQKTDQSCQKEREEHWDLQMKASALAENGKSGPEYVDAADKAEAAGAREQECRKATATTQPLTFLFDLHASPDSGSEKLGRLRIEVRPWIYDGDESGESQVNTVFIDKENKETPFTADIPHPFNSKPAVFHTVMAKKGTWYQLPPKPFPTPAWVNFAEHSVGAPLSILKVARPVFVKAGEAGTYVVFRERKGRKLVGVESMEDRGKSVPKGKPIEVNLSELFDSNGHIRAKWRADDED
jgi:hypothetical protein